MHFDISFQVMHLFEVRIVAKVENAEHLQRRRPLWDWAQWLPIIWALPNATRQLMPSSSDQRTPLTEGWHAWWCSRRCPQECNPYDKKNNISMLAHDHAFWHNFFLYKYSTPESTPMQKHLPFVKKVLDQGVSEVAADSRSTTVGM